LPDRALIDSSLIGNQFCGWILVAVQEAVKNGSHLVFVEAARRLPPSPEEKA
jgi:hypothetical protein